MKQSDSSPKLNATGNNNTGSDSPEKLERYFSALKNADYSGSFPAVESWMYKTNIQIENQKKERKLRKMKQYFVANKFRLIYPIIFLAVLIAACSMPVTQTETLGHVISWATEKNNTTAVEQINRLSWIKNGNLNSNENVNNGKAQMLYTLTLTNSTDKQVEGYVKELQSINGITTIKAVPISNEVKRPLYSAALNKFFSININASGMNDQELQKEVSRQLKEQGVDMNVDIKTNSEGRREIKMQIPDLKNSKDPKNFEVNINDGNNNEQKLKVITKGISDASKYKGKTDDEIRKMVRDELGNQNLKDNEIKISREGDEVKIKVEVEKGDVK